MAISDDEARRLIELILEVIGDDAVKPGGGVIADFIGQWQAEIEAGRPIDRKLKVNVGPGLDVIADVPRSRTSSTGEFVGKTDYTPIEQLDLLLEAVGLAYVAPAMMASKILKAVELHGSDRSDTAMPAALLFAAPGEAEDVMRIDDADVTRSARMTRELALLIAELSREGGLKDRVVDLRPEGV